MIPASTDPGSVDNVWGLASVVFTGMAAAVGPYLVMKRSKERPEPPPVAPERAELEAAYGVPTDDVSDMAIRLIFSVRQELKEEKRHRANVERRLETWVMWARDLGKNWDEYRARTKPPAMPEDDDKESWND